MTERTIVVSKKPEDGQSAVALFVQTASKFNSQVLVKIGNKTVNAKSIMGVMTLNFEPGSRMDVSAEGVDEIGAIDAISELLCVN